MKARQRDTPGAEQRGAGVPNGLGAGTVPAGLVAGHAA